MQGFSVVGDYVVARVALARFVDIFGRLIIAIIVHADGQVLQLRKWRHQKRLDATASIKDVLYIKMNEAKSKETYSYDGTNVTWANLWGSSWWLTSTGWVNYGGPTLSIGSVPATSVLGTNHCFYRNTEFPGAPYTNGIKVSTRGYGSGSGTASFVFAIDPKGPPLGWHWGGSYSVVTIY